MPGALNKQLPNRSLSGPELKQITLYELREMMKVDPAFSPKIAYQVAAFTITVLYALPFPHEPHQLTSRVPSLKVAAVLTGEVLANCVAREFERMTALDYIFGSSGAYKKADIVITLAVHVGNPVATEDSDANGEIQGEVPLKAPLPKENSFIGLQRIVTLTNPNIDRIAHDLPIVIQRSAPATPILHESPLKGEPPASLINPPTVINDEHHYDKTQFPVERPPVDKDVTLLLAAKFGVPVRSE